jgi:hypothetical protein
MTPAALPLCAISGHRFKLGDCRDKLVANAASSCRSGYLTPINALPPRTVFYVTEAGHDRVGQ